MTKLQLPESFQNMMQQLLGEEYVAFLRGFDGKRQFGLRVNTSKIELEEFERIAPFHLRKIPWIPEGYFYEEEDAPARHPFYAAGLYYLQEPSAMTPASRLPVQPGERVLDLCAAPGGKATALGAKLRGKGLLVANDINNARAKALLRNLELFGISNAFVTNEPPYVLAEKYPEYFDKIMVDAPCSGEGMFRKNPAVIDAWQEKGPEYFSRLQKEIILHGADMLRPGGKMLYSTCTFSPAENERVITHLLRERPEMEVIPMEDYEGFSWGLTAFAGEEFHESCHLCRRIFPHKMPGEGHFMALLHKKEEGAGQRGETEREQMENTPAEQILPENIQPERIRMTYAPAGDIKAGKRKKDKKKRRKDSGQGRQNGRNKHWWEVCKDLGKEQQQAAAEFFSHVLLDLEPERMDVRGEKLYYVPEETREAKGIHFLRNGIYMGDFKKKRFEPSQPFALILSKDTFDRCLNFSGRDPRLENYLRGESLSLDWSGEQDDSLAAAGDESEMRAEDMLSKSRMQAGDSQSKSRMQAEDMRLKSRMQAGDSQSKSRKKQSGRNGWYLVLADGFPLGFGKVAGATLKNKYPAGWRK